MGRTVIRVDGGGPCVVFHVKPRFGLWPLCLKRWTNDHRLRQPGRMPTPLDELPIRPLTVRDLPSCVTIAVDRGWPPDERKWRLLLTAGHGYGIDAPSGAGLAGVCVVTRY